MKYHRGFRDLIAWQKAMALTFTVYAVSESWPKNEQYRLTEQAIKAAISVPSNIAEGNVRTGIREFAHHLSIAHGSLCELETQLEIAYGKDYLSDEQFEPLLEQTAEVGRLIRGLIRSLGT